MTPFNISRDVNGYNGFGLPFSDTNFSATLTNLTVESLVIPGVAQTQNFIAIFSFQPGTNVWVANNHTAAVPVGATLAATNSILNPTARIVKYGDTLSFITDSATADISVALYAMKVT